MNKKKMKNKKYRNVKIFSSDIIKIFKEYFQNIQNLKIKNAKKSLDTQTDRQTNRYYCNLLFYIYT